MYVHDLAHPADLTPDTGRTDPSRHLYASFSNLDQAVRASGALLDHGLLHADLSAVSRGSESDLERYRNTPHGLEVAEAEAAHAESTAKLGYSVTTAEDAVAGATAGAEAGLGLGLLLGAAALVVPGVGLVFGAGALAVALGGVALTTGAGAIAGGVAGSLLDQGVPARLVGDYDQLVTDGGALVVLTLPSSTMGEEQARAILDKYGAQSFGSCGSGA